MDDMIQKKMLALLKTSASLICSDMAPNMTGIKIADQENMLHVLLSVFDFAKQNLSQGGNLVVKCFESQDIQKAIKALSVQFAKIHRYKPPTSRSESTEFYLVALNKK